MPTGPKSERRPANVIGNAVKVMRIATGEEADTAPNDGNDVNAKALGAKGGAARRTASGRARAGSKAILTWRTSARQHVLRGTRKLGDADAQPSFYSLHECLI